MNKDTTVIGVTVSKEVRDALDKEVARLEKSPGLSTSRSAFAAGALQMRVAWREIRDSRGELVGLIKPGVIGVAFTGVTAREPILEDGEDDGQK